MCDRIRAAARGALLDAVAQGDLTPLRRIAGQGVGDVAFGIDVPTEEVLSAWLDEQAQRGPLSLLTEDTGWRHRGPGPDGPVDLPGFDHGGPRISVDPIDGTRCIMADLRSAWTVLGFAGPGESQPTFLDLTGGISAELPTSRAAVYRVFTAERGKGCTLETSPLEGSPSEASVSRTGSPSEASVVRVDDDDRADHGYFCFFRYEPAQRVPIVAIETAFLGRLAEREGAATRTCFEDQYLANAGQLALLTLGTYRFIADVRATLSVGTSATKPYDVSGAILCAQEAGCVVEDPRGEALDFPIDATTPVAWVGYANAPTATRLRPHLTAVLDD